MPGDSLDKAWRKLSHDQRLSTCHQLSGYLSQLQEPKGKRIEAADGGLVTVGLRYPRKGGPFNTEKEFNEFPVKKDDESSLSFHKHYARAALADNHEICFVHSDVSPRNILVDERSINCCSRLGTCRLVP